MLPVKLFKRSLEFQVSDVYIIYRLQTYIVTSKPKRISVADGFVHIMLPLSLGFVIQLLQVSLYAWGINKRKMDN